MNYSPKSKKAYTKMYDQLPLGPGVPSPSLAGFDFAPIESRKPIERDLNAFITYCLRDANSLSVKVIKAEWGEGKTDAYERYIFPQIQRKGEACYFVSTSTVIDKIKNFNLIFPTTKYVIASKFLAALFTSIIDESFSLGNEADLFPSPHNYQDNPLAFIEESLKAHAENGFKKIFVFIDEFEELLSLREHELEFQNQIISGIKELVNGQVGLIHEHGKHAGMLNFFIACTPYAYNRIMDNPEIGQMTGSVKSRFTTVVLPEVGKKEAIQFLFDLIRFSYKDNLPEIFPFLNSGPLNGIYSISHGNLREMIKLFVKLLSTAVDEKSKQLKIIDCIHFLRSLEEEEVAIYGATGAAIDNELLVRILSRMKKWKRGKECSKLLRLLIGEFKPFATNSLGRRLGIPRDDIHDLVSKINSELVSMGIGESVTQLMPLYEEKTFLTVKNRLSIVQNNVVIGENQIPLRKFEERLTYYSIQKDGKIIEHHFLPKKPLDLQLIFEDLDEDGCNSLFRSIENLFDPIGANRHYIISQEFANQIFPSPLWLLMDFVKDKSKRMDLWRKASKEFRESEKEFKVGVLKLIEHLEIGKFEHVSEGNPKFYRFNMKISPGKEIQIIAYVHASTGNISPNDLIEINKDIRSLRPNLVILIYTGEIEGNIPSHTDGIENSYLQLHFRKLRALQLIVEQLARKEILQIDKRILDSRLREISDEIDLRGQLNECYGKCKRMGIVVDDLLTFEAESGSMLAGILKLYINFLGESKSSEELFSQYQATLEKLKFFGDKDVAFAPIDIEASTTFVKYEDELIRNGFLLRRSDLTVDVEETPIEKRIMHIMKKYPATPLYRLKQFFIHAARAENIFEKVYIPILEHKGRIRTEANNIIAVELKESRAKLDMEFLYHQQKIKAKAPMWNSFAKICVSKGGVREKAVKIIDLEFFNLILNELIEKIKNENDERIIAQKMNLSLMLLDYYAKKLEPKVDSAFQESLNLKKELRKQNEKAENAIMPILLAYDEYCSGKKYKIEDINEHYTVSDMLDKIKKDFDRVFSPDQLQKIYRDFGWLTFHCRTRDPEEAYFFNLKFAKLKKDFDELNNGINSIVNMCSNISEIVRKTEEAKTNIQRELATKNPPTDTITSRLLGFLQNYQSKPMLAQCALPKIGLHVIFEFFKSLQRKLSQDYDKVNRILGIIDLIYVSEKQFLNCDINGRYESAKKFFLDYYNKEFRNIETDTKAATTSYESVFSRVDSQTEIPLNVLFQVAKTTHKNFVEIINPKITKAEKDIESIFSSALSFLESTQKTTKSFLEILKKGIGENAFSLCDSYAQDFETEISITEGAIKTVLEKGETIYNWPERLFKLQSLRDKLFNNLSPLLPEKQGKALLEAVRLFQEKGTKWVDLPELVEKISKNLNIEPEEAASVVKELGKHSLLIEGSSLPI